MRNIDDRARVCGERAYRDRFWLGSSLPHTQRSHYRGIRRRSKVLESFGWHRAYPGQERRHRQAVDRNRSRLAHRNCFRSADAHVRAVSGQVFSTPNDLEQWLTSADRKVNSGDGKHKYTYAGKNTEKQTALGSHPYVVERFPSVMQLWTQYPQIALEFPDLTAWMNYREGAPDPRVDLVENLALAIWADARYSRSTEDSVFAASLSGLYRASGFDDEEDLAIQSLTSGLVTNHTYRDEPFPRNCCPASIARAVTGPTPEHTAVEILERIQFIHATDASPMG